MNTPKSRWSFRGKLFPVYVVVLSFIFGFAVPHIFIYILDHTGNQTRTVFFCGVAGAIGVLASSRRSP